MYDCDTYIVITDSLPGHILHSALSVSVTLLLPELVKFTICMYFIYAAERL